jgi:serine/threonine-protein kinase
MGQGRGDSRCSSRDDTTLALAVRPPVSAGSLEPGQEIGGYRVRGRIGQGGIGGVYLADEVPTGRHVALKPISAFDDGIERWLRLRHPNIVRLYGIEAGFLVLEFVDGRSLRDLMSESALPLRQALGVMAGVLAALGYAHENGALHRDLKPENVLVSQRGAVKLADFAGRHGTPQYMSPEQATGSAVDCRSDLYAAGVILYELVCGRAPFRAPASDGDASLMTRHVLAPPPQPTLLRPDVDVALERVILRALAKRPEDRYQTAAEFSRELGTSGSCAPTFP